MGDLLPLATALQRVLRHARGRRRGRVPLAEAGGLVLAAPVRADRALPPFDRATLDGYAVAAADPALRRGGPLRVIETVGAGSLPRRAVRRGEATLVMTGAPVPRGADAVVRRESAALLVGGREVLLRERPRPGDGVHGRGSDARRGAVVVPPGTPISPRITAVLASVGAVRPEVFLRPRVAVGATGDELRPGAARRLGPAAIRNSNGPTLEALVRSAGGAPVPLGTAADRPADLRRLVRRGLRADVLLLSGGVSAGDRDLVPGVLAGCGVRRLFHGVDLRPGKPLWCGVRGRTLVFGLPGNPVSAQVTFALLVAPAIRALLGHDHARLGDPLLNPFHQAGLLDARVPREGRRTAYRPAALRWDGARSLFRVRPVPWNGSGDFAGFARAEAIFRREGGAAAARRGDPVRFLFLADATDP
jgi:molybdopterin molybdotransferase